MNQANYTTVCFVGTDRGPRFPADPDDLARTVGGPPAAQHRYNPLDRRRRQVVYLAAPIPAYLTAAYDAALSFLHRTYPVPRHAVLSAREAFSSTPDWRDRSRDVLSPVTGLYIVGLDGYVGAGVLEEWAHLVQDRGIRHAWAFAGDGSLHQVAALVALADDMPRFPYHFRVLDPERRVVR